MIYKLFSRNYKNEFRFAERREGEGMPIPQLRSFGACSGFLIDTCPLGTRR